MLSLLSHLSLSARERERETERERERDGAIPVPTLFASSTSEPRWLKSPVSGNQLGQDQRNIPPKPLWHVASWGCSRNPEGHKDLQHPQLSG